MGTTDSWGRITKIRGEVSWVFVAWALVAWALVGIMLVICSLREQALSHCLTFRERGS